MLGAGLVGVCSLFGSRGWLNLPRFSLFSFHVALQGGVVDERTFCILAKGRVCRHFSGIRSVSRNEMIWISTPTNSRDFSTPKHGLLFTVGGKQQSKTCLLVAKLKKRFTIPSPAPLVCGRCTRQTIAREVHPADSEDERQEAKTRPNIPLQEKFHRAILRRLRNISDTP